MLPGYHFSLPLSLSLSLLCAFAKSDKPSFASVACGCSSLPGAGTARTGTVPGQRTGARGKTCTLSLCIRYMD
ncbi:hypothetical protein V8C34DRAFT_278918 [Trichoderma compactum]